jgi:hypothetical protein
LSPCRTALKIQVPSIPALLPDNLSGHDIDSGR